ncbi:MAG: TolC family protein [Deltaproteobacteria bacterium]|nr:TolC family protein [Deltaproteobacteria bacterium]
MKSRIILKLFRLFFFVVLLFPQILAAAESSGKLEVLERVVSEAVANSYKLRARQERVDQAEFAKKQARADFFPKFGVTYSYNRLSEARTLRSTFLQNNDIVMSSRNNYSWSGIVRQPVFSGFAIISQYRLAELGIDQSELEFELEKMDLVLRVKEAYFNVLAADKAVEVARKDVESRTWTVKVARSFFDVGMIPINDVLKAEVELANAEQALIRSDNSAMITRAQFNKALARPIHAPVSLEDILTYSPVEGDYEDYVENAFCDRPEIKILDVNILQADQRIKLAKSRYYPEVTLKYEYIKEGEDLSVSGSPFHDANRWEALAVLSWTFWEWGKTYYAGREQESVMKQLVQMKSDLEDAIRLEVQDAILGLETAEKNIPTTQKAVRQGEENLRVNEERYKAQVSTITDLLDAQTLLAQGRLSYYRALYDHNLAKARLERALGTY